MCWKVNIFSVMSKGKNLSRIHIAFDRKFNIKIERAALD
jgi:hypothetical protein